MTSKIFERLDAEKKDKLKNKKDTIEKDSTKYINTEPTLDEAAKNTAVISFGRMNPVTVGHEKLVTAVQSKASTLNGTPLVYLSQTQDSKKNPLSYNDKIAMAKSAFGPVIQKSRARTIIDVANELQSDYKNLVVVVGSDRVKEFETLLNKYNGKDYTYDSIEVVSAGDRDPDSEGVEGMSASKMRDLAKQGDFTTFKKGLPTKLRPRAASVFSKVRRGMNIQENKNHPEYKAAKKAYKQGVWDGNVNKDGNPIVYIKGKPVVVEDLTEALTRQQRMKRKQIMRRLKSKIAMGRKRAMRKKASIDTLRQRAKKAAIKGLKNKFAKGKNYADLDYNQRQRIDDRVKKVSKTKLDTLARKMLPKVKDAEKQRMLSRMVSKEDVNQSFENFIKECSKSPIDTAIQIAEDLGANPNFAIREIEKISKGLSNHALVQEALASFSKDENTYSEYTFEARMTSPQDPDVKDMPGSQPKGYYKGVDKDKKDDRARHFAKYAKKSDDDPASYKPAPGDKEAKTKPSKHTKKFKDMFGERTNYEKAFLKKPHMLLKQNGSVKLDKRFKVNRKAPDETILSQMHDSSLLSQAESVIEQAEFILESNPKAALKKKAEKTGISYGILKKVFDRGVAAWRTGHRPGTNPTQWGLARVNSFATKSPGTWGKADKDLAAKVRG